MIFAMKMVQVSSEAKARPIMTALTRTSADRNIDHGDSSRSATAVGFSDRLSLELADASEGACAAADGVAAAGACAAGAACAGIAGCCGCDSAGAGGGGAFCCAPDGGASGSRAQRPLRGPV